MINCVKVQPHLLFLIWPQLGRFFHSLDPSEQFFWLGSGSKTFSGLTYVDNHFWFLEVHIYFFVFNLATIGTFFHFLDPSEQFFSRDSSSIVSNVSRSVRRVGRSVPNHKIK